MRGNAQFVHVCADVTLQMHIGDGLLGAMSSAEWRAFTASGYVSGEVYSPTTRELRDPVDVTLELLAAARR